MERLSRAPTPERGCGPATRIANIPAVGSQATTKNNEAIAKRNMPIARPMR